VIFETCKLDDELSRFSGKTAGNGALKGPCKAREEDAASVSWYHGTPCKHQQTVGPVLRRER